MTYSIADIQGRVMGEKSLQSIDDKQSNEVIIDLSDLCSGTYQFIIKTNNTTLFTEKLIIAK